eukprot:5833659-Heterocapsa_arctica.AAC.1
MDNDELLDLMETDEPLEELLRLVLTNQHLAPTPPTKPPSRENLSRTPELQIYHQCMNCPRNVAEFDRFGRHHRHCGSNCRDYGDHNDRCERFQDNIERYEERQR